MHRLLWLPLALALISGAFRASPALAAPGEPSWTQGDQSVLLSGAARSDASSERVQDRSPSSATFVPCRFELRAAGFTLETYATGEVARGRCRAPATQQARAPPC